MPHAYFKGKSAVSVVIKKWTWSEYSHYAWINDRDFWLTDLETGEKIQLIKEGTIYESWHRKAKGAQRNGVRKGRAGDLHKPGTPVVLKSQPMTDEEYNIFLQEWEVYVADPAAWYDFRGVISGFLFRTKRAHSEFGQFCSEVGMRCLSAAGIRFLIDVEPFMVSPDHMATSPVQEEIYTWYTGFSFPHRNLPAGIR